jgi:hypothetical protein
MKKNKRNQIIRPFKKESEQAYKDWPGKRRVYRGKYYSRLLAFCGLNALIPA